MADEDFELSLARQGPIHPRRASGRPARPDRTATPARRTCTPPDPYQNTHETTRGHTTTGTRLHTPPPHQAHPSMSRVVCGRAGATQSSDAVCWACPAGSSSNLAGKTTSSTLKLGEWLKKGKRCEIARRAPITEATRSSPLRQRRHPAYLRPHFP
jgi:hypothetical protein